MVRGHPQEWLLLLLRRLVLRMPANFAAVGRSGDVVRHYWHHRGLDSAGRMPDLCFVGSLSGVLLDHLVLYGLSEDRLGYHQRGYHQ